MNTLSATLISPCCDARASAELLNRAFLKLLPAIQRDASIAFRRLDLPAREEAVLDVVAYAFVAFSRLIERGRADRVFAAPLARFGIKQARCGRRVGERLDCKDVMSRSCQMRHGYCVESLSRQDKETGEWQEIVVQDRHSTPAEVAAARIDISAWLASLSRRNRAIALTLAKGEPTFRVARRFRLSSARISQLRRELHDNWHQYQGNADPAAA